MAAVYVTNLVINSGADFGQFFNLEGTNNNSALDLTGYDVNAEIRKWSGSSTSVSFGSTIMNPATSGQIYLSLSSEDTVSLKPGRYVYDILIIADNGLKTRVVEGMVLVREGVTR